MNKNFLELCNKITSIEDLVILSYSFLYTEFSSTNVHKYNPNENRDIQEIISVFFERSSYDYDGAIIELTENISELGKRRKFNFNDFYSIITSIDRHYKYVPKVSGMDFNTFNDYITLSESFEDYDIMLLPRPGKTFIDEFNKTLKEHEKNESKQKSGLRKCLPYNNNNINAYLKNLLLINKNDVNSNQLVVHEYIESKYNKTLFINNILNRKSIKLVLVPVTKKCLDEIFDIDNDGSFFWIKGIKSSEEEKIVKLYITIIDKYRSADVDFIVFPELFLTENILNAVQNYLLESESERLQFFILGSMWEDYKNKTVVMTSDGEYICDQLKQIPFTFNNLEEKLINDNSIINILDFPNFARINIFICRDITDDKLMSIPKQIGTNLIIAPSYSSSLNMKGIAKNLASNYYCTTIMVNSCSAKFNDSSVNNRRNLGFVCQPLKNGTESDNKVIEYKFDKKCNLCNYDCLGYTVEIMFNELYNQNEKTFNTVIKKT